MTETKKRKDTAPPSAQTLPSLWPFYRDAFLWLDIIIAAFELFVHGANDLCNAYQSTIWLAGPLPIMQNKACRRPEVVGSVVECAGCA